MRHPAAAREPESPISGTAECHLQVIGSGDAGRRVAALLRAHGGEPAGPRLPARVSAAVVAVEDERFWHHGAVDPVAIARALISGVAHPGRDPGGSTLSVYFGHGHWGIAQASRGYFATAPDRLTWGEATLLAGLPQAPSADDPVLHFAQARQRQREVLDQLVANHGLTAAQAAAAYSHTPRPIAGRPIAYGRLRRRRQSR